LYDDFGEYNTTALADAAHQQSLAILGGMTRLLTSAHRQQVGEAIWRTED